MQDKNLKIMNIDFNCDLAQSFGVYKNESEYDLLDYVSSVNISCGFHAGDPLTIKKALLINLVTYFSLSITFAKAYKMEIEHVRPHGAMYRQASENIEFSRTIAKAIQKCSQWLVYYGATGYTLEHISNEENIKVAHEVHLEKIYRYIIDTNVVLDMSTVSSMDSSGLGIILAGINDAEKFDTKLFIMNPSEAARHALERTGFLDTFNIIHAVTEVSDVS